MRPVRDTSTQCSRASTRALFHEADDKLLTYLSDDGQSVEPQWCGLRNESAAQCCSTPSQAMQERACIPSPACTGAVSPCLLCSQDPVLELP